MDFKISKPINMTGVTRYIDPPDISVIFRRENNWQDPTCSERRLEDLMTNDVKLGGSGAWSPTSMAHFDSMAETRQWSLITGSPRLIGSESHSSYRAYAEGIPHMDRQPTYDSVSSSSLQESLEVRLDEDLEESAIKDGLLTTDNCDLLTSCCGFSLDIDVQNSDNIAVVNLSSLFKYLTIISVDEPSFDISHDQRRSKSRFDELVLTIILVRFLAFTGILGNLDLTENL